MSRAGNKTIDLISSPRGSMSHIERDGQNDPYNYKVPRFGMIDIDISLIRSVAP
jgi:hypothetical protein